MGMATYKRIVRAVEAHNAYHEAAHAVVEFLYGSARSDLVHVSLRTSAKFWAHVRSERVADVQMVNASAPPAVKRAAAMRQILIFLAGPAVNALRDPGGRDDWLSDRAIAEQGYDGTDYSQAYAMASAIADTEGRRWQILRRGAAWTDELIRIPRVWTTIATLAKKLEHGKVMSGNRACDIMEEAFASKSGLYVEDLGRKWQRRLMPPAKRPATVV